MCARSHNSIISSVTFYQWQRQRLLNILFKKKNEKILKIHSYYTLTLLIITMSLYIIYFPFCSDFPFPCLLCREYNVLAFQFYIVVVICPTLLLHFFFVKKEIEWKRSFGIWNSVNDQLLIYKFIILTFLSKYLKDETKRKKI